jgi:tetratricopeptide (TPR) repeat protein
VRRRLVIAGVWVTAVLGAWPARADWQVHRDGSTALFDRAEQALRENPDDDRLAERVVQLAGRRGAGALRARFRARAEGATSYAPRAAYAQLLLALGDATTAAAAFDAALRLAPDAPASLAGRARALAMSGSSDAAVAFERAIAREARPAQRRRLIEAALAVVSGGAQDLPGTARAVDLDRVVALRRELARLEPENDRRAEQLADALAQAGRPAEAAQLLEQRVPPDRPLAKLSLALRAARLRLADRDAADADRAAANLRALLEEIPRGATESRRAVWACARDLARARGTLNALGDELAKNSGKDPGPVEWDLLGQVRDELGDLDGALAATQKAHALAPRDAEIGRRLLGLLDRLDRGDEAIVIAGELSRLIPSEIGFATGLADRQRRRGDRPAAAATFDRALAHFSREPAALESLAEAAARWGDDKRALAAWTRLVRVDPASEVAVVGLGEAQFQSGKRDEARRTWAKLRTRARSPVDGDLRLGELLFDHELLDDALVEARRAEAADPAGAAPHRLLAQISERQRRLDDAIAEWRRVLTLAREPRTDGAGLRREARMRLLALLARQGRGRLDAEVRRLHDEAGAHPDDVETAMFLAEAEQRLGDVMGAMATLRTIATRGAGVAAGPAREAGVEAGFALARLLKQTGQAEAAAAELGDLARLSPGRAREAEFQIAEIALGRYDVRGALGHAAAAAAGADPAQLARIGEIQERAGDESSAVATYRAAIARGAPPTAALALARILERQGDATGAADVLEALLRGSGDDASVSDAARQALGLAEALDRLPALVEALVPETGDEKMTPARRRALVDVLERLLPALYRDPAADATRARLGRAALRPLLDLIIGAEVPDRKAVELLGLLGNADAAPALARVAAPAASTRPSAAARGTAPMAAAEARQAALVALGRLGDPRGVASLAEAAGSGPLPARAAAVWSLGRIADPRATGILWRAVEDPRPEIAALACLGLGRHADARAVTLLGRVASDGARPVAVRSAAALGLGRAGGAQAGAALLDLLDTGDEGLTRAAALALAWTRDPRALPALLARALLPDEFALSDAEAPLAALRFWLAGGAPPDEARSIVGNEVALQEVLAAADQTPPAGDLTPLWRAHTGEIDAVLSEALSRGGGARRAALDALDDRTDGPGLGALAPPEALPPDTLAALREVAWPLADKVAAALDDPDRRTRAAVLRVLAKLDDERLTPARLADAVGDGASVLADAAVAAAQILVRAHPPLGATIATAIAPLAADDGTASWTCRLAAVELLATLGPAGLTPLDRAANDRNALVRAAAIAALDRLRSGPKPPSG